MARGVIRLVHGHTKSTLITYFSGMKIDPKYAFLHTFLLICPSCPFQNLSIWPKTHTLFSNFTRFCTPNRCTRVQCLVLKNNPNYVNFWTSLIPPWHSSGPPPREVRLGMKVVLLYVFIEYVIDFYENKTLKQRPPICLQRNDWEKW